MVQQQVEEKSPQDLPQDSSGLDAFKVVDSTPSEQLEVEAELDTELGITQAAETEVVGSEGAPQSTPAETQVQTESAPEATAEPVIPAVEPPRQFSADEVAKMQSAWMKQINEAQAETRKATSARDLESEIEVRLRQQEQSLAGQYGEEEARKLVRTAQNEKQIRGDVEVRQENKRLQEQIQQNQQGAESQAKSIIAQQIANTNGLTPEDVSLLMTVGTPEAMVSLGQRLSQQTLEQRQARVNQRGKVPAETAKTTLENGRSTGNSAESATARLNRLRGVPGYDWNDADHEFMRTGRM